MRDALIIGAGPAGSLAGLLLARAGWRVTVVEQHRFPRDKVCGECLSAMGLDVLGRAGLMDSLRGAGAVALGRALLHAPDGRSVSLELPRPLAGLSRAVLDELLLRAAAAAGAIVRQPARCEYVDPGSRTVHVRDLVTNTVESHRPTYLLIADGKAALLPDRPLPTADLGMKAHFEDVDGPRDAIELFGLTRCYGGLAPIEGGRWNAAFSVPAARVRDSKGDVAGVFTAMESENVNLRRRLARARQLSEWLASPLPRFGVRRRWPANVIPLGNAAAAVEPIGGEGMGLALRSAELAAEALVTRTNSLPRHMRRLWAVRRAACRIGGKAASRPLISIAAVELLGHNERLARAAMALMGKTE